MADEPEMILEQMDATRCSLTEKLATLERQVVETVQDAREAVTDTVESVKETVQGSVESVKESLDVGRHAERHPWATFGTAVGLGFLSGWLTRNAPRPSAAAAPQPLLPQEDRRRTSPTVSNGFATAPPEAPSLVSELAERFSPEIDKLKGMAIGALAGLFRDALSQSAPPTMQNDLQEVVDQITVKLGGKPVPGPILDNLLASQQLTSNGHARARTGERF